MSSQQAVAVNGSGATSSADAELTHILEAYLADLEAGHPVDPDRLLAEHPAIADRLRACLASLHLVEQGGSVFGPGPHGLAEQGPALGQLGDFRLLRELGRGGMGVVYEAEQLSLDRRVALKILPFAAALDPKQLQRFKNEAQAAAHLHHTNIVPVFGVGCERGVHYYAMQFIEGQTLAAVIQELRQNVEGRMTNDERMTKDQSPRTKEQAPGADAQTNLRHSTLGLLSSLGLRHSSFFRTAANLGVQAAEALEHAHQLGVVHRDIKPANLLVDARRNLWITDFGLAHCQSQAGLTMTGDLAGTLRYMSPEQALAKRGVVDHRTDVYSLGVTLYELLTLAPAFNGRDRQELLGQIASEEPKPPRRLNPAIPAELETIVLKAIEKNQVDRYATAQELADDLERFLKDEPIRAKRPTLRKRLLKWARRHRAVVVTAGVATAVLVLMALAALAVSYAYVSREKDKKEAALQQAQDNAQAAQANLQLARKAVDEIHEQLANKAGNLPQLQALEEGFLQQALIFYRQFAQQNSKDAGIRLGLARIYRRFGQMRTRLNQYHQAEEALMQAVALLERLVADDPSEPRYRAELATTHCKLDFVLGETKGTVQAEQALRRAVALLTELVAEHPDAEYRIALAGAHNNLGLRLHARPQEAERAHQLAVTLCEQLEAEFPKRPTFRGELVRGHGFLGQVRAEAGRFQEAEKSYRQAIVLYEQQADTLNSSYYREMLPNVHFELAKVLHALDRLQEAEDQYRLAVELYEKEVAAFPRAPHRWYKLYDAYTNLVRFLVRTGRPTEALEVCRKALDRYAEAIAKLPDEVADHEGRQRLAMSLAVALQESGQPQEVEHGYREALEVSEKLAAQFPRTASHHLLAAYWHNALGTLATAAGRAPEAANAHRQAAAHYRAVLEVNGSHLAALNNLARLLANCLEAQVRDAKEAVQLAKRAVDLSPGTGYLWNTLGLACYRTGDWKAAIAALEKSMQLYAGRTENQRRESFSTFPLAMAHWKLGDQKAARQCYDRAVGWMEKHQPKDEELRGFRTEAVELLGMEEKD